MEETKRSGLKWSYIPRYPKDKESRRLYFGLFLAFAIMVAVLTTIFLKKCDEKSLPACVKQLERDMVLVEGDTFDMGAPDTDENAFSDEKPQHKATVSDFYICKYEVTQALWEAVMGENPSYHKGKNLPVEKVSYDECLKFISKLVAMTGKHYRLPTEQEWEFAARGGKLSKGYEFAGSNILGEVAWYKENSGKESQTHPVGKKLSNELGLYDMSGNVMEWTSSVYFKEGYGNNRHSNTQKPSPHLLYVIRGSNFKSVELRSRIPYRSRASRTKKDKMNGVGLRLALSR